MEQCIRLTKIRSRAWTYALALVLDRAGTGRIKVPGRGVSKMCQSCRADLSPQIGSVSSLSCKPRPDCAEGGVVRRVDVFVERGGNLLHLERRQEAVVDAFLERVDVDRLAEVGVGNRGVIRSRNFLVSQLSKPGWSRRVAIRSYLQAQVKGARALLIAQKQSEFSFPALR